MDERSQQSSENTVPNSAHVIQRRAEALLNAKKVLDLADKMKLVSLNVAIESAKTRGATFEAQRVKQELSDLTNQAVRASKEISDILNAISELNEYDENAEGEIKDIISTRTTDEENEFRKAIRLRKDLDEILAMCSDVIDRLDRVSPTLGAPNTNREE